MSEMSMGCVVKLNPFGRTTNQRKFNGELHIVKTIDLQSRYAMLGNARWYTRDELLVKGVDYDE